MMIGTYPIIVNGKQAGELTVSKEGMLTRFDAVCADTGGGILRLSLYGEGREGYLGVMLPGNGLLRLTKSLSKLGLEGFPENPTHAGESGQGAEAVLPVMMMEQPQGEAAEIAREEIPPEAPPSAQEEPPAVLSPEPASPPMPPPTPRERPAPEEGTEYIDFSRFAEQIPMASPEPEPMPEPIPEPMPEPIPEPMSEPMPEPVPEPVPEPMPEPMLESVPDLRPEQPEPVPDPDPEQDTFLWKREPGGALNCVHGELRLLALPANTPRLPMEKAWDMRVIEGKRYAIFKLDNGKII